MRTLAFIDESDTGPMGFAMSFSDREKAQVEKVGNEVAELVRPMGYRATWRVGISGVGVGPNDVVFLFEDEKRVPAGWLRLPVDLVADDNFGAGNIVELFASKRINTLCQLASIP